MEKKMTAQKAFKILGLTTKDFPITEEILKKCYREKVKVCHPDDDGGSHEMMVELNNAKSFIEDNIDKINNTNNKHEDETATSIDFKISHILRMADIFVVRWERTNFINHDEKIRLLRQFRDELNTYLPPEPVSSSEEILNDFLKKMNNRYNL
jgi:hypothetical protein